mmetsp:Transcript_82656/g.267576  ORF Transcript_82656/g.267576 Transcript_82656/m.267576 type:complete len:834 (+) Transcript_82656:224-2725(+)
MTSLAMLQANALQADRMKVIKVLVERGNGSLLRGWRVEIDPDGSLDVNFLEFCRAAQRLRLNVDSSLLFGDDSPNEMTLDELDPESGAFVNKFRKWMTEKFGGPSEMFTVLEPPNSEGRLSRAEFMNGILAQGVEFTEPQIFEIFNLLDSACCNSVAMEDVMFLDLDPKTRMGAIRKAKNKPRIEHEQLLTKLHRDITGTGYPEGHRLAPRAWHAPDIEKLPEVVIERRHEYKDRMFIKKSEAYALFKRHLVSTYGNGIRAWRKGLDPGATFRLSRIQFLQYCRRLNLEFDASLLWSILDSDADGSLRIEEVAPQAGAALAVFWKWAKEEFGSCADAWPPIMKAARPPASWKSTTSLKYGTFLAAIKELGWTTDLSETASALCQALDRDGCGIISISDVKWFSAWVPPEWLFCSPDKQAWLKLSKRLLQKFKRPLTAWRRMDQDDSNSASWDEFVRICDDMDFQGNRGGAWRYLDRDTSGAITLWEWHQESAQLLSTFKDFLDSNFGSVKLAFDRIDTDNSGSVTFSELNRACKRRDYKGNVKVIFKCLDVCVLPGFRSLSYKDVSFLDSWEPELNEDILDDVGKPGQHPVDAPAAAVVAVDAPKRKPSVRNSRSVPSLGSKALAPGAAQASAVLAVAAGKQRPKFPPAGPGPQPSSAAAVGGGGIGRSQAKLPTLAQSPPSSPAHGARPSLSRAEGPRPLSRDIATPTLSELMGDLPPLPPTSQGRRKAGVGCLRSETLDHMRQEMERLKGAQENLQREQKKFKAKARLFGGGGGGGVPSMAASVGALPKVRPPAGRAVRQDEDVALEDYREGPLWMPPLPARPESQQLTDR